MQLSFEFGKATYKFGDIIIETIREEGDYCICRIVETGEEIKISKKSLEVYYKKMK